MKAWALGPVVQFLCEQRSVAAQRVCFAWDRGRLTRCLGRLRVNVGGQDVALALCPQRLAGDACIGDCDLDNVVRVDELIAGVAMALGRQSFAACPAIDADGDGAIAINEIVVAVNSSLEGCPAVPTV